MASSFKLSMLLGATLGGSVRRSFSETENKLQKLGTTISSLKDKQKSIRSFSMNTVAVDKAQKSLFKARREVASLRLAWKKNQISTEQFGASIKKSEKNVRRLSGRLAVQQERLSKTRNALKQSGISTNNLSRENERLGRTVDNLTGKYGRLQTSITKQRSRSEQAAARQQHIASRRADLRGQIFDTAATAVVVSSPFRAAIDFEASVSKLRAITSTDDSDVTVEQLARQARNLGKDTPFTASQSIEAQTFLAMAGFGRGQVQEATPGILNLSLASGEDVGRTADIASNVMSQFSLETSDIGGIGDVLTAAFTNSNTTLDSLSETLKFAGSMGSVTGSSLKTVTAMAAVLGSAGVQSGEAGRALRQTFIRLAAPTAEGTAALNKLGVNTIDPETGDLRDVPTLIAEISESLEGRGSGEVAGLVKNIFGLIAAPAVLQLLDKTGSEGMRKIFDNINDSDSRTNIVAQLMTDNTQNAISRMGSALENLKISLGSSLLPVIEGVAIGIGVFFNAIATAADFFPPLTAVVTGAVVGLVSLRLVVLGSQFAYFVLAGSLSSVKTAFTVATAASTWHRINLVRLQAVSVLTAVKTGLMTAAQWAFNFALTANPIGLIIVGIGALIGVGVVLVKNWGVVSKFFKSMWAGLKESTKTAVDWLVDLIGLLLNPFETLERIASSIGDFIFGEDEELNAVNGPPSVTSKKGTKTATLGTALVDSTEQSLPVATAAIDSVSPSGAITNTQNVHLETPITINAAPGMSSEEMATKFKAVIEEEKMQMSRNRNSMMFDLS